MSGSEFVVFLVALAFVVISVIRNVQKQRLHEQKAEKAHEVTPHKPVKKSSSFKKEERHHVLSDSLIDQRFIVSKELRTGERPCRKQRKAHLPGGGSLRTAILNKEILDPPVGLR